MKMSKLKNRKVTRFGLTGKRFNASIYGTLAHSDGKGLYITKDRRKLPVYDSECALPLSIGSTYKGFKLVEDKGFACFRCALRYQSESDLVSLCSLTSCTGASWRREEV